MSLKFALVIGFLIYAGAVHAEVIGNWKTESGHVQMLIDKQDQGTAGCKTIEVEFIKTERTLSLQRLHLECGASLVMDMDSVELELQDGKLYQGPEEVGAYTGASLTLKLDNDGLVRTFALNEDAAGKIQFHYLWTDGFTELLFDGEMLKQ